MEKKDQPNDQGAGLNANIREKIIGGSNSKSFHKGVKCFLSADEASQWDARLLFPGEDDRTIANRLAKYFNGISQEYSPLQPGDKPVTYDHSFLELSRAEVAVRLKRAKKTTLRVKGDIFASLYELYADKLAEPIAAAFNAKIKEGS